MLILVKGDDVGSGTKANVHHSQLLPAQASMGSVKVSTTVKTLKHS